MDFCGAKIIVFRGATAFTKALVFAKLFAYVFCVRWFSVRLRVRIPRNKLCLS